MQELQEQSFRASLEFAPFPAHLKKITPYPPTDFRNATVPQCRSFQVSILTISWTTQTIYTPEKIRVVGMRKGWIISAIEIVYLIDRSACSAFIWDCLYLHIVQITMKLCACNINETLSHWQHFLM